MTNSFHTKIISCSQKEAASLQTQPVEPVQVGDHWGGGAFTGGHQQYAGVRQQSSQQVAGQQPQHLAGHWQLRQPGGRDSASSGE